MTRKIWQSDFAGLWFGGAPARKAAKPCAPASETENEAEAKPLGIVERNRRARREKWALRLRD